MKKELVGKFFDEKTEIEKRKRQFRAVLETVEQYNLRKTIDHELKRQATLDKICKLVTPRKREITNSLRTQMTEAKETIKQSKIRKRKNYETDSSMEAEEDSDEEKLKEYPGKPAYLSTKLKEAIRIGRKAYKCKWELQV